MDREYEDFQREIQKETGQSEQIVDEEQEIGKVDREVRRKTRCIGCFIVLLVLALLANMETLSQPVTYLN